MGLFKLHYFNLPYHKLYSIIYTDTRTVKFKMEQNADAKLFTNLSSVHLQVFLRGVNIIISKFFFLSIDNHCDSIHTYVLE